MIIDDLIVLGRAVPEQIRDGRVTICLGGYSPSLGFIRIYPTKYNMDIKRWSIIEVEVERNSLDTRKESWKIVGSKSNWDNLHLQVKKKGSLPKRQRLPLTHSLASGCVSDINNARNSLGIIKPDILRYYFQDYDKYKPRFFGIKTKKDFPREPRIQYRCLPRCLTKGPHDQQVLEWGFFKWIEKQGYDYKQVWKNAMLGNSDYNHYFFVGNQVRYRTSFLIISILRFKMQPIQTMIV